MGVSSKSRENGERGRLRKAREDDRRAAQKELLILNAMRYDALLDEQEGGLIYMNAMAMRNGSSLRVKARGTGTSTPDAPPRSAGARPQSKKKRA